MNYRHAFHAGNFADVFKHAVLSLVIMYLREKPAAIRVIDTHAGAGLYDLTGPEASRTGEWRNGIGRLFGRPLEPHLQELLGPYLEAIARFNPGRHLIAYPGSPALALELLRPQDRLTACELDAGAAQSLARHLRGDRRAKAVRIDGWTALTAYVPPKERRGIVLLDPPFEQPGEFARLTTGLAAAHRKWANGIYLVWYAIKDRRETDAFLRRAAHAGIPDILRAELAVAPLAAERLNGSGLLIVNPPWPLEKQLAALLAPLAGVLARNGETSTTLAWLTAQK
jgi:23S rRNA (adenine2030-N6)-methyltransferase